MAIKTSTGLRNAMMVDGSFKDQMDGGFLQIYAGTEPASADDALGGAVLLCKVSNNGGPTGLTFELAAVNGSASKLATEVWRGTNAAGGAASFYRYVLAADTGAASTTEMRVQGKVGIAGADLNLSSTALVAGADQAINYFNVTLPTY